MIGVMAFSGMTEDSGNVQSKLQSRAIDEPQKSVTGISSLWLSVCRINRAMCGTASPMKDIGPQNAVMIAESKPVENSNKVRALLMLIPRFSAYWFPSSKALSGLMSMRAKPMPTSVIPEKKGICSQDTPLKFPSPQKV